MGARESPNRMPLELRAFIDGVPALAWSALPDGSPEFFNQRFLDYSGLSPNQVYAEWKSTLHQDDMEEFERWWGGLQKSPKPGQTEVRFRRADGEYRWFQISATLVHDEQGNLIRWYGINIDIDDRKRAEEAVRSSERALAAIINTIPTTAWTTRPDGHCDFLNQGWLDYTGMTAEQAQGWGWAEAIHPKDRKKLVEDWQSCLASGTPVDTEARIRRFDASYRWFLIRANPLRDESGNILKWYGTCIDIEDRKRGEEALRARELSWLQIVDNIPGLVATMGAMGEVEFLNRQILEYFGKTNEELKNWALIGAVHPDDLPRVIEARKKSIEAGQIYEIEHRCRRADGVYRWFQVRGLPVRDTENKITAWYLLLTDIDDRKRAEQKLRQSEEELRTITDAIRQFIVVLALDGTTLYANRVALESTGFTIRDLTDEGLLTRAGLARPSEAPGELAWNQVWRIAAHPDDRARIQAQRQKGLLQGTPFELEGRCLFKTGQYRWQLFQYNPLKDQSGQIIRWYVTATDIEHRKQAEERVRNENLALREQIDRDSMFEDIVGSSEPLRRVLTQVGKVAPSDSTVLILGETGTGKELIARAIHKRSKRASQAFIGVNCGAIPASLIASELFGHEKGAFTGATQRRLGRFETANGGTIFLDEVGDLPPDIQIALLRVLQEREIERIGSDKPIPVDVRVVAATHRDMEKLVSEGKFRQDLLYRLNVVPIVMPSLRERASDIPLLVEYFIARFGRNAGKKFRTIGVKTLKLLQDYEWPGNVRELQNVIERAVILSDSDTFAVDETWFKREPSEVLPPRTALSGVLLKQEKEMIEAALAESRGRVSGPTGAASKLGLPTRTLDSKIKRLGIDKYRFKSI